jgi:hypothetical protein
MVAGGAKLISTLSEPVPNPVMLSTPLPKTALGPLGVNETNSVAATESPWLKMIVSKVTALPGEVMKMLSASTPPLITEVAPATDSETMVSYLLHQ